MSDIQIGLPRNCGSHLWARQQSGELKGGGKEEKIKTND